MLSPRRLALLLAAALLACSPPRIPGTEIPDEPDTRAILKVIESYAAALQRKDAGAILALVSPAYYDDAGTRDPSDDLDRVGLEQSLPKVLGQIGNVKLEVVVRNLVVEKDRATAEVFSDTWYSVTTSAGPTPHRDSDVHRMTFFRAGDKPGVGWMITSGI
jgi:ketosteroid isomerase-like protein